MSGAVVMGAWSIAVRSGAMTASGLCTATDPPIEIMNGAYARMIVPSLQPQRR